ncbi:hypothetical protein [Luteolibacter marinus]|uniref:hypothetical protein n=1 Tax=Luteolibacter marinus TaxID=2776705 RepID=UPI0018670F61|nr:hypothetical protein [Luteolibacter marinus]
MKILVLLTMFSLGAVTLAEGSVIRSQITTELSNVGLMLRAYQVEKERFPSSWEEFDEYAPGFREKMKASDLTRRFVLLEKPVDLPRRYKAPQILVISREPFRRKKFGPTLPWVGRTWSLDEPAYTAIVLEDGGTFIRRLPEEVVRAAFQDAKIDMPVPSGLGLYPHEREHRKRQVVFRIVGLVMLGGILVRFWRAWRGRSNKTPDPVS